MNIEDQKTHALNNFVLINLLWSLPMCKGAETPALFAPAGTNCWVLPERVSSILVTWLEHGRTLVLTEESGSHVFLNPRTSCHMDGRRFSEFVGECFQAATGGRLTQQMLRRIFAKGAAAFPAMIAE